MSLSTEEIQIPDWTAEEYLQSSKPYEWLYEFRDNPFVQGQLLEAVAAKARKSKVAFKLMWNAYLTSLKSGGVNVGNVTKFDGQDFELISGEYVCDDNGITYFNGQREVLVCRHPIMPVRRLQNIDTGAIKLEIAARRGAVWRKYIFDRSTLASGQKILDLAQNGIAVDSENCKELARYLTAIEDLNYDKLGITNSVGRLGWMPDGGFSPYVDGLEFDGDIVFKHLFDCVQQHGNFGAWLELMQDIRRTSLVARLQLAASFASVLVEPLGCLPFFLHVWGGTEAGKTVGLMVAASVWGNPAPGEYVRSFNSTAVGQEYAAGFLNSLPLCLDELQMIGEKKEFDKIIYALTEGLGKNRAMRTGGLQKMQTWRNCTLSTGEMPLSNSASGGGAVNRIVDIDVGDAKLFSDPRHVANTVRANYGFAGKAFVLALNDGMELAQEAYKRHYAELVTGESTEKQSMAAALILTADELCDEWIFHDGQRLATSDIAPFLTSKDDVNANKRALEWLYDFVASNPARFRAEENNGELWGVSDENYIYIIKSVFDREMRDEGYNPTSFLAWANRARLLLCDDGRYAKRKRLPGTDQRPQCVCIVNSPQSAADDDGENDELPF